MTRLVYLAHPIDDPEAPSVGGDVERAVLLLLEQGLGAYQPGRAWRLCRGAQPSPTLQNANHAVLALVDGVLVMLPEGKRTVGAVLELAAAVQRGLPTVVWAPGLQSWALSYLGVSAFGLLGDAVAELAQMLEEGKEAP